MPITICGEERSEDHSLPGKLRKARRTAKYKHMGLSWNGLCGFNQQNIFKRDSKNSIKRMKDLPRVRRKVEEGMRAWDTLESSNQFISASWCR